MPNRIPDLLAAWREALRMVEAPDCAEADRDRLTHDVAELRRLCQVLTDQHAPESSAAHAEAAVLINRTRATIELANAPRKREPGSGEWY